MERITTRLAVAAAAAGLALLAPGCAGNATTATGTNTSRVSATSRALPNPFTITARHTARALGLDHPDAVAIGPSGNLYVTDLSQRVTVISPAGKVVRRWGEPGTGTGEFRFVSSDPSDPADIHGSITVGPDGKVYVSDSGNGRVQVFTPQGQFVRQFGRYGSGKGQFLNAFDLVVDGAGNVYVADDQAETLTKFSPAGKPVWLIGGGASRDPDLNGHFHVAVIDSHGRLVVGNDDQSRVLYIDSSGHKVDAFGNGQFGVGGVSVDTAGRTYLAGFCAHHVPTLVFDRTHRLIAKWPWPLHSPPLLGRHGEMFALACDGSILRLHITLPGA